MSIRSLPQSLQSSKSEARIHTHVRPEEIWKWSKKKVSIPHVTVHLRHWRREILVLLRIVHIVVIRRTVQMLRNTELLHLPLCHCGCDTSLIPKHRQNQIKGNRRWLRINTRTGCRCCKVDDVYTPIKVEWGGWTSDSEGSAPINNFLDWTNTSTFETSFGKTTTAVNWRGEVWYIWPPDALPFPSIVKVAHRAKKTKMN